MKADLTWLWPGKLAVSLQHNLQIQHGGIRFAPVRIRLTHLRKVSLKQSEAGCLLRRWWWRWHVGRAFLAKQNCRKSWTRFKRNYMHLNGNLQGLYTRLRRCLWSLCLLRCACIVTLSRMVRHRWAEQLSGLLWATTVRRVHLIIAAKPRSRYCRWQIRSSMDGIT